jgi:SiaC family regulatory phosphoprotein
MENLSIQQGIKTPYLNFSKDNGVLEIKGKSIPENSIEFYRPVYEWLDQYNQQPQAKTQLVVQLEYFNTSSSKCLLDVFRKLEVLQNSGKSTVEVLWLYEEDDEDIMEAGDDYQTIVKLPFKITKAGN